MLATKAWCRGFDSPDKTKSSEFRIGSVSTNNTPFRGTCIGANNFLLRVIMMCQGIMTCPPGGFFFVNKHVEHRAQSSGIE